jgi:hypothetical protein
MVLVGEKLLRREPWIADRVVEAFDTADAVCWREYDDPKPRELTPG